MNIIEQFEKDQIKTLIKGKKIPQFHPGDTVRVNVKVREGTRERIQAFEGVCIRKKNRGLSSSFTVRKISYGEGIERILPLFSPQINKIEVVKIGSVRRSKLYYLRKRSGKSARIAEKNVANPISKELEKNNNTSPKQTNLNKVSDDDKVTKDIVNDANISVKEIEKVDEKN